MEPSCTDAEDIGFSVIGHVKETGEDPNCKVVESHVE